jgi:addiction module HigA family antidote
MNEIKRDKNRCPTHPGAILREFVVDDIKLSKVEIAQLLGISRQHLHDILAERKPISPQMAVRLAKLVGNSPEVWMRLQTAYDLWHASRETDTSKIPTLVTAS